MARVVQCPACGQAHPLDTLAGTPTFSCTGCGRTLRTPTELVRPSGATPAVRATPNAAPKPSDATPRPVPAPSRPPRSRIASGETDAAAAGAAGRSKASKPRSRRSRKRSGTLTLPVRIGAWVVAVLFGLLLTWLVASAFGFISRSQIVDMFRSSSPGNYIRLFLLIPVWAFMSACVATAIIEGTRYFLARRAGASEAAPARRPPARPSVAARVPEAEEEPAARPGPPREPLPPGQRTRIRPREPTV